MAKTKQLLSNGLRVKFIVKAKKYLLYAGQAQVIINYDHGKNGFNTADDAAYIGLQLTNNGKQANHQYWTLK